MKPPVLATVQERRRFGRDNLGRIAARTIAELSRLPPLVTWRGPVDRHSAQFGLPERPPAVLCMGAEENARRWSRIPGTVRSATMALVWWLDSA